MLFFVKQTFPIERVLFESNRETEAIDFLDNLILLGDGWFEVWEKGQDIPIQAGGEQAFSPYHPEKLDVLSIISVLERAEKRQQANTSNQRKKNRPFFHDLPGTH